MIEGATSILEKERFASASINRITLEDIFMLTLIIGSVYAVSLGALLTLSMGRFFERIELSETTRRHGRFA